MAAMPKWIMFNKKVTFIRYLNVKSAYRKTRKKDNFCKCDPQKSQKQKFGQHKGQKKDTKVLWRGKRLKEVHLICGIITCDATPPQYSKIEKYAQKLILDQPF